jgi:hypothetical protein
MSFASLLIAAALGSLMALLALAWVRHRMRLLRQRYAEAVFARRQRVVDIRADAQAAALRAAMGEEGTGNPHLPGSPDWVLWETAYQGELLSLRSQTSV